MPNIEWNLNGGTIIGVLFIASGFYWTTRSDLKAIKEELKMLGKVITDIAVQNTRLDNQGAQLNQLRDEITLLRQGRSFVQPRLDGEYPPQDHR